MSRFDRAIPAVLVLALGLSVSACSTSGHSFDPTEWVPDSVFGIKDKLPGERKPVFPEGVPGVSDGVPPELIIGNQQAAAEAQIAPEPPPKPAPAARPQPAKPKPRTASTQQAQPRAAASTQQSGQSDPATGAQPAAPSQAAWPPPDANTFSR